VAFAAQSPEVLHLIQIQEAAALKQLFGLRQSPQERKGSFRLLKGRAPLLNVLQVLVSRSCLHWDHYQTRHRRRRSGPTPMVVLSSSSSFSLTSTSEHYTTVAHQGRKTLSSPSSE